MKNHVPKNWYRARPEAVIFIVDLSSLFCGFLYPDDEYELLPCDLKEEAGGKQ